MSETIHKEPGLFEIELNGAIYRLIDIKHGNDWKNVSEISSELAKNLNVRIQHLTDNLHSKEDQEKFMKQLECNLDAKSQTVFVDYVAITKIIEERKNPTVKNFFMIEQLIAEQKYWKSKSVLYRALPHLMQYRAFTTILKLLELENKIRINDDGSIIWTRASPQLMKELEKSIDA